MKTPDIISRILNSDPKPRAGYATLKASVMETELGDMIAITNDAALCLLEFIDCRHLDREILRLESKQQAVIIPGKPPALKSIERELRQYFAGKLNTFTTPIALLGSPFQNRVWKKLNNIPYAQTRSYANIANAIGNPNAFRAVANANGANQLAIVIPCHRVINSNGQLGGYSAGLSRKEWLLEHEQQHG